jgi:hypothetical protein
MPLQETSGNVTTDAYGGGVAAIPNYIEDVFSTWLYTGNSSTQTITNGINLSGKGGLIWRKPRSTTGGNLFIDTAQGITSFLQSNTTGAAVTGSNWIDSFNADGFTMNSSTANVSPNTYASWTFRKQPKFFDIVTFTTGGGGVADVNHSLGSIPGCVIVKRTTAAEAWNVYHKSLASTSNYLTLNTTATSANAGSSWISTSDTTINFPVNGLLSGNTSYVAYLFADNAGGFGLTGTDNVISCGSYVGTEARLPITLGYEPQWVMIKDASTGGTYKDWYIFDNMRKLDVSNSGNAPLLANSSAAEGGTYASSAYNLIQPTSTGMIIDPSSQGPSAVNTSGDTYIYIAIRRGPMKVPTDATKVFSPLAVNNALNTVNTTGFPIDLQWYGNRDGNSLNVTTVDRLRGVSTNTTQQQNYLRTSSTAAEVNTGGSSATKFWGNTGFWTASLQDGANAVYWNFQRAPSFFDEVCYTGTGSLQALTHNLGAVPELIIVKQRNTTSPWTVYAASQGLNTAYLNRGDVGFGNNSNWGTAPTSTTFSVQGSSQNTSGGTYVAYLFATCAGVSKVGSYTGNGTTQTINCSFTTGARFVLIKNTDVGDWYVYDTARGMTTLTDPYLLLNSTAAESATLGSVTTVSTGFAVNASVLAAINTNAASYIYLSIA